MKEHIQLPRNIFYTSSLPTSLVHFPLLHVACMPKMNYPILFHVRHFWKDSVIELIRNTDNMGNPCWNYLIRDYFFFYKMRSFRNMATSNDIYPFGRREPAHKQHSTCQHFTAVNILMMDCAARFLVKIDYWQHSSYCQENSIFSS